MFTEPLFANALAVYYYETDLSKMAVGEVAQIRIFFNTENKEINVMEGTLEVAGPVDVYNISTENSVFNLWPEQPNLSSNQKIEFTGGVAGGVYGKDLRLFDLFIKKKEGGNITMKLRDTFAYQNDGNGTKTKVSNSVLSIDRSRQSSTVKMLYIILTMVVLYTGINIWKKIFKNK